VGREDAIVLAENASLRAYYDAALAGGGRTKTVANLLVNEVARALEAKGSLPFQPTALGELAALVDDRTITPTLAKDVLADMIATVYRTVADKVETVFGDGKERRGPDPGADLHSAGRGPNHGDP